MQTCILVPHFNHEQEFLKFLPTLVATGLTCVVVDDGSTLQSLRAIKAFVQSYPEQMILVEHGYNRGKGAAVRTGLYRARSLGFSHAIQIDADGQHCVDDIAAFIEAGKEAPNTIICGRPVFDASVPKIRLYGRKITTFWVTVETCSTQIKDGLCGFRLYPLTEVEHILDRYYVGSRMDFDTEILVKAVWTGVSLRFLDTRVIYPEGSASHFRYVQDNLMLIGLHTRLMLGMLRHLPILFFRRIRGRR